jgi:hypothetical protein
VKLDPEIYICADDQCDLTGQVTAAIRNNLAGAFELLDQDGTQPATPRGEARPFEVVVECPGPDGDGGPTRSSAPARTHGERGPGRTATAQHSITLTARPPRAVSLYLPCMPAPVSRIVRIALSSET